MRCVLVVIVLAGALAACTGSDGELLDEPPPAGELSISLRFRPSCGFNLAQYETSCLSAVRLTARGENGTTTSRCTNLADRPSNLESFVFTDEPAAQVQLLSNMGEVVFEVRGIHDKNLDDGLAPCSRADEPSAWLFFGESEPFDVKVFEDRDAGPQSVVVPLDCRDCEGGCQQLGTQLCPVSPASYCVPGSASLTCEKPCANDDGCFEQTLSCDVDRGRCDQDSAPPGGFCSECTSSADCDTGYFCVGLPGEDVGLCAERCPLNRCKNGTKCNRLGNDLQLIDQ